MPSVCDTAGLNPRSWCAGSLLSRTKYDLIIAVHVQRVKPSDFWKLNYVEQFLQAIAIENDLRGTLRNFGLKVGIAGRTKFEARIKELVENLPDLAELVEPMLVVRR